MSEPFILKSEGKNTKKIRFVYIIGTIKYLFKILYHILSKKNIRNITQGLTYIKFKIKMHIL